jgi:hypothetical protein
VIVPSSLIFMTRSTWVKSLSMRRKLPRVMRAMAATALGVELTQAREAKAKERRPRAGGEQ